MLIPHITQLLEKELACTLPTSSMGTANTQLPAPEYRLTSLADRKPMVKCLILLEFSFSPCLVSNLPISIILHLLTTQSLSLLSSLTQPADQHPFSPKWRKHQHGSCSPTAGQPSDTLPSSSSMG